MIDKLSMTTKTICLNMIVKNEEHIIESTLVNILQNMQIDYWVISDTGSTDNTMNIIRNFFSKNNINGELFQDEWVNFGYNRTKALEYAYNKTDYLFIFDADDLIHGNIKLPTPFDKDLYQIQFENPVLYHRAILISNRMEWKYMGVLHEYICNIGPIASEEYLLGDYHIQSRRLGDRSKNPNKYLDDALILEKGYETEINDIGLKNRYSYYCAQSYQDAGKHEKAIEWYERTLTLDYSPQYKYCACIKAGDCYHQLKRFDKAIEFWGKSYNYDKERLEGITKLMEYFYNNGQHFMVSSLYNKFKHIKIGNAAGKIFLDYSKYHDFHYFASISGCYCDEHKSAYEACKYLLLNNTHTAGITIFNLQFYINHLKEDNDNMSLLNYFVNYIIKTTNVLKDKEHVWKLVKNIIKERLPDKYEILKNIMLSSSKKYIDTNSKYSSSKKILIYTGWMTYLWNESHIDTKALGGSEKAVAYLSREFPNEYDIIISGDVEDDTFDNRTYIHQNKLQSILDTTEFHTIIISRNINFLTQFNNLKCFQLILSLHDTHILNNGGNANDVLDMYNTNIDKVITLTSWHKSNIESLYPNIPTDKIDVINNGIDVSKIHNDSITISKIKNKFIWSSRTERGLHILLNIWREILEKLPNATLDICSYGDFPKDDSDKKMLEIINDHDSITYHGKLNTTELYALMSKSEYWLYTNTFPETSCITALEMLMNEVICLYYPNAGLNDTIGNYGIPVKSGNEIETILQLTAEKKALFREKGREYALSCSWKNRAEEWSNMLGLNTIHTNEIQVINLKKRYDRKEKMISQFKKHKIDNYNFFEAIDGNNIIESIELKKMFEGNDFNYRKGVIGCALSHITLWKQLVNDIQNDFYVILEDDVTLLPDFKEILNITINKFINGKYLHVIIGGNEINYENLNENKNDTENDKTNIYFKDNGYYKDNELIKKTAEGAWGYILHKNAAKILLDHINNNSIKHAIDHPEIFIKHTNPKFINKNIIDAISCQVHFNLDTDVQLNRNRFNWVGLNQINNKIGIFNSFSFHYEMFGFILNYAENNKYEVDIFTNQNNTLGWFDFYREKFNHFNIIDFNTFEGNTTDYFLYFLSTDDDPAFKSEWKSDNVICLNHYYEIRTTNFKHYLNVANFKDSILEYSYPCYPLINYQDKIQNTTVCIIGGNIHHTHNIYIINNLYSKHKIKLNIFTRKICNTNISNIDTNKFDIHFIEDIETINMIKILKQSSYVLINYNNNDDHNTGISCSGSVQLALSTLCKPIMTNISNKYLQIENALEFDMNSDEPINIDGEIDFKASEEERSKYIDKFDKYLNNIPTDIQF